MVKLSFDDGDGIWRTIGGKHIFIRTGESLSSAMKRSGKFKLSNKRKGEVKNESKSFNDLANESKTNLTREELKEKYGTDDVDLINVGKEKEDRVTLKEDKKELNLTQRQIEEGNRLNEKAENGAREDAKTFLSGKENYDGSREDFIRDLSNEWGISKEKAEEILHDENIKHPRNFTNNQQKSIEKNMPAGAKFSKTLEESNVKTFADEIKERGEQSSKKIGEIKDFVKVSDGTYLPIREGETEAEVKKAYNERQEKYRRNLEPEVSKNLRDPRRLWDQDLVDTYIEMNERGEIEDTPGVSKNKFTKNMKNMEGKPLYSPDRIKGELNSGSKAETISKAEYDKMPNDYKGTLKELVNTAEFRGENKQDLIKQYEKMGYDVDKDKTILVNEKGGTVLKPVKISDDEEKNGNQITNALRRKAYQKYLREHPASKITFEDFKDMRNIK